MRKVGREQIVKTESTENERKQELKEELKEMKQELNKGMEG